MNHDAKESLKWRRLMSIMFMGASLRNEHGFFVMDTGSKQFGPTATPEEAIDLAIAAVETAPRNIYHLPDAELGDARCRCVDCEGYRIRRLYSEASQDALMADAALGRLVRQMPSEWTLERSDETWFARDSQEVGLEICTTPEAALLAAGVVATEAIDAARRAESEQKP